MKKRLAIPVILLSALFAAPSDGAAAPTTGITFSYRITDVDGAAFPEGTAGLMVCPREAPLDRCEPMIFGPADARGVAQATVEPDVRYRFTALVTGTGWPCGAWISPTGTPFFFSEGVVTRPGAAQRPGLFTIAEPACP